MVPHAAACAVRRPIGFAACPQTRLQRLRSGLELREGLPSAQLAAQVAASPCVLSRAPARTGRAAAHCRRLAAAAASGAAAGAGAQGRRSWAAYLAALEAWPLATKATTSAVLAALGDALSQLVAATASGDAVRGLDVPRLLRFAAVNGVLVAPVFHVWYGWLGQRISKRGYQGAFLRMLVDQLAFSPLFLFIFLACVRSLGAQPLSLRMPTYDLWWTASCVNWAVLPLTQFLNFWLVPAQLRVLFSNVVAVGMSAVMSCLTAVP